MTALAIIRTETGIIVASDGAAYDDAGICRVIRSKVQIYPEISTVIASRGAALAQKFIEDTMFWGNTTLSFDALMQEMPDLTRGASEYTRGMAPGQTDRFSLFLCGWSEVRERWETYVSRSYPWDLAPGDNGQPRTAGTGDLVPLPSIHLAPEPYPLVAERFGLVIPPPDMTGWSAAEVGGYGILSVCASRACLGGETGSGEGQCCVGGFVQVTTLTRQSVTSQIVHRWPDPVGEVLDFRRGDPSPWHQWPVEMLAAAGAQA